MPQISTESVLMK